ncbi:MAG: DUF547 domain-containing protein [Pseudomonadota bacterium]|nr:DUF547 domain-containing protein [Pseudomonadota bacterium]MEC8619699.1 DUF547 domain-containing protein [Pseudomonadota bacterium]
MSMKLIGRNFLLLLGMLSPFALAAPKSELWPYWNQSRSDSNIEVDHQLWQSLLSRFVRESADGINRVAYREFDESAKLELSNYLESMSRVAPTQLNQNEQLAYWINLYNAQTIQVVLDHPKKKSILSMGPFFAFGPWDEPYLTIEGKPVTLNDIEHRILRPIWQDHRLHYVLNCASIGCPNLNRHAYQAELIDQQLAGAQANFLRHPRAVTLTDSGKLQVTSLFDWYLIDFAQDISGLLAYLAAQRPDLAADLSALVDEGNPKIDYVYDWDLNVVD